ncbi:MAG: macro domain-containing protein [Phycisphaerae bacterium]
MTRIHVETGDLTRKEVDAIVNAANNDLKLGGGLAGAIARAGGPRIQAECDGHGPVQVGQAAITSGGNLPAKYVIHQASMRLGGSTTAAALEASTRAVLEIAENTRDIHTLAFPATGTGIAGFPADEAARIMVEQVVDHSGAGSSLTDVYFILFDEPTRQVFQKTLDQVKSTRTGKR